MTLLIAGLVLFIGAHLVPTLPRLRAQLADRLGDGLYRIVFSLVSGVGLVLIVVGYGAARGLARGNPELWVSPAWMRHVVFLLMIPAMVLLVAAYVPSRIRTAVRHPMLAALKIWAFAHLLVNGDLASVLLFGSLLAYGVWDRISVRDRAALGPLGGAKGGIGGDATAVIVGLVLYGLMLVWAHAWLIGVPLLT
jgi:uncharacterized membrane protein